MNLTYLLKRFFAVLGLSFVLFACTGSAVMAVSNLVPEPVQPANPTENEVAPNNTVPEPGLLEEWGPPGTLLSIVFGGIFWIVKAVNEGKSIDVDRYKEIATEADSRASVEIGKVYKRLDDVEAKLDEAINSRDEYRALLEEKKRLWHIDYLAQERRHREQLESQHDILVVEIATRRKLEKILADHGISYPDTPPPYTDTMLSEVTKEDLDRADEAVEAATGEMPVVAEIVDDDKE